MSLCLEPAGPARGIVRTPHVDEIGYPGEGPAPEA